MRVDSDNLAVRPLMAHIASRVRPKSAAGQSSRDFFQGLRQILTKQGKITLDTSIATNHHMVSTHDTAYRQYFASKFPEAPFHPVACDRITNLSGNGNSQPHCRVAVITITHQQNKATICRPLCRVSGKEIPALADCNQAESFLRPRARRAWMTARPPTVAIRARKPCRRARTRLLG